MKIFIKIEPKNHSSRIAIIGFTAILMVIFLLQGCNFKFENATVVKNEKSIGIDNDTLNVKLDLNRGGTISYISISGSERNLVNIYDEGRYIQQSYYAGKSIDRQADGQSPDWSPWSWNPIQAGDAFGNRAEILEYK
jgi:hypothetical protein